MKNLEGSAKEYFKDYPEINFRVAYTYNKNRPEEMTFAAQPYEFIVFEEEGYEPNVFLLYGKLNFELKLRVGFNGFSFTMTKELHQRIGTLYEEIEKEFLEKYGTRE